MNRRVLLTGAAGFTGQWCMPLLCREDYEVVGVSRHTTMPRNENVDWVSTDLMDPTATSRMLQDIRPTHLLHLAWITTPGVYWTSSENTVWAEASIRLLEQFVANGGQRAVLAGTCAEYDWSVGVCQEDTTPIRPVSAYGQSKDRVRRAMESMIEQGMLSAAWGRIFFNYGLGEPKQRLISSLIDKLLTGQKAACTSGTQKRDFIYVKDTAAALVTLLGRDTKGAINVGTGQAVSVREVAETVGELLDRTELLDMGALLEKNEPACVVADICRLRNLANFEPQYDLWHGLSDMIAQYKAQS